MKKAKEKGITLLTLVITIIILLILSTIGVTVGSSTIDSARFTQFKSELKVIQTKVNDLNENNKKDIGLALSEEQKNILNKEEVSNIIYKNISVEEKEKIQNGFRYCNKNDLGLDSVNRDYLINVEYRYVIFPDGFKYNGITYYMIDQIEGEVYNVRYNDKNQKTGYFDVTTTSENNKCKVEISNIRYDGYVDNWQVKYKLEGDSYWKTSNDLTFYIKEEGNYNIKVVHGDEIALETKTIEILTDNSATDNAITNNEITENEIL